MNEASNLYYCSRTYDVKDCPYYLKGFCNSLSGCKFKRVYSSQFKEKPIKGKCKYYLPCGWCELKNEACSSV